MTQIDNAYLNPDEVQRRIIAIVSRFTGYPENEINPDTDLISDLGVSGDDGDELFLAITKTYPIDLTGSDLAKRFGPEGTRLWQGPVFLVGTIVAAIRRFILRQRPPRDPQRAILIRDLVNAALTGKWASPR